MADIDRELDIIEHERSGAMVKQAIHDAIDKLNQTANKRPTAKSGVPIDEVLVDTGWIGDWKIGELIAGEILTFDGDITEGTESDDVFTAEAALMLSDTGKVFLVTISDDSTTPTIDDNEAGLTWNHVTSKSIDVEKMDPSKAVIGLMYPGATIKGYIYDSAALPDPANSSVNDLILLNASDDGSGGYTYVCTDNEGTHEWTAEDAPAVMCNFTKTYTIHIWSANASSAVSLTVNASLESEDATFLSFGAFVFYGAEDAGYHICARNQNGRFYNDSKIYLRGKVATVADLPETVTAGDIYVVEATHACYKGVDGAWERMPDVYESYIDSKAYTHDNDGLNPDTARLFLCIGYDPATSTHLDYVPNTSNTPMTPRYKSSSGGSILSAWHQDAPQGGVYPSFKPSVGVENYLNKFDGSVAVITIEVGGDLQ